MQKENEFFQDYMDFLAHHEFGLSHKVSFSNEEKEHKLPGDQNTLEYWLEVWFIFYSYVYSFFKEEEGFYFFCYEDFCENPNDSLVRLGSKIDLSKEEINTLEIKNFTRKNSADIKEKNKYSELYLKLVSKSINHIDG
jgi:hypothetical protein